MVVLRINKTSVESFQLPTLGRRAVYWDDRLKGFGVRVTSTGNRTYVVQHRIGGKGSPSKTYTIGKHGSPWTADTARDHAKSVLESVRIGVDPTDFKREAIIQRAAALQLNRTLAFNSYADQFLNQRVTDRGLRREAEIRSIFLRDLIPYFRTQPITLIVKKDVDRCLSQIGKRSHSSANKAYRWLKNMFNCAVLDDDITKSPLDKIKMPFSEPSRDRVLNDSELVAVWESSAALGYPFGPMIKMLIATGQRLREVAEIEWSELNFATREWVIPSSRTKNGKKHVVPLNGHTIDILMALMPMRSDNCNYVFSTNLTTPVSGFSRAKRRLDALVSSAYVAIPNWTFHDLRRSFATGCQKLGIPIEHTEALLNHSNSTAGLVGIYQRHDYAPEKRRASDAWDEHLCKVLASES